LDCTVERISNIPTSNLNSVAGEVAFSALSRLQDDPARRRTYFLKGFSLVLGVTLPITIACGFFAPDVVLVLLGSKWRDAAPIFRWLAPTILVFAIANPLSWLLTASGLIRRLMKMSLVIAPVMIIGYFVGLPYGPKGVACAYSLIMVLWLVPLIAWAVYGTEVSFMDIVRTVSPPLIASILSGLLALMIGSHFAQSFSPLVRLMIESTVLVVLFLGSLMLVATQRELYFDLFRGLTRSFGAKGKVPVSA
jgi:O-antigen/teichoic acid export membrane protein